MSKFAGAQPLIHWPIRTSSPVGSTSTFEGAPAATRDAKSDLFLLAAANMVSESTFYEGASARDERFRSLVHTVTLSDPDWVSRFVPYLRNAMQMRSAAVVMAAESAWQRLRGGPAAPATITVRQLVASACSRLDEPAEFIGYWRSRYGRALPMPVKRGIADAFVRLCNERSAIKYDGQRGAMRLGDVIEIVHPKPTSAAQAALFRWLLDRRKHDTAGTFDAPILPTIGHYERLRTLPPATQREHLLEDPSYLRACGLSWEHLAGLGPMDAAAWEAVIPSMGYMALLRNLRNFDQAGVSEPAAAQVIAKLTDAEQVARSRQLPFRFLSAYRATTSVRWTYPLEVALNVACGSVPELPGRTLVLVDTSASMRKPISARSSVSHLDVGGLFGAVTALRNPGRADLVGFADGAFALDVARGQSALRTMDHLNALVGTVGHGTNMLGALQATFRGHDRVVIFSDMQCAPHLGIARRVGRPFFSTATLHDVVPTGAQVFAVNTSGYAPTPIDSATPGFFELGGFSDRLFTMMSMLAKGRDAGWPF